MLITMFALFSCNTGNKEGKNPYCEFVDGIYTFDFDLRRTISYQGTDFDFKYFNDSMKKTNSLDAKFIFIKGIGYYFDDNLYRANEIVINYSSLFILPKINKIENSYLNILTTLQAERVVFLVKEGLSYVHAVKKSKKEIESQICNSAYFNSLSFEKNKDFALMSTTTSDLLIVLTRALSYSISKSVELSNDMTVPASVWDDYIENYAFTGDMLLHTLEPIDEEARCFVNGLSPDLALKVSVSRYEVPFSGGVPQVDGNSIYYGVDTTSCCNKLKIAKSSSLQVRYPNSKNFISNGYVSLNADMHVDSLNMNDNIRVRVRNLNKLKADTVYTYKKLSYDFKFSTLIWLKEEAKYQLDFVFGKDSVSYEVDNKLTISIN